MNDTETQVMKASVSGNGMPTCVTCKYWDDGVCRGVGPARGEGGYGVWPMTKATDACGLWRNLVSQVGSGAEAKIPTKRLLDELRLMCDAYTDSSRNVPAQATRRIDFVEWMVEQGMSKSAAVLRIQALHKKGYIGMGRETPPEYPPTPRQKDEKCIFIWPGVITEGCDQPNEERLIGRMRTVAPAGSPGIGVRALWRACSDLGLSLGTIHRLLGVLFVNGLVERVGKDWRCAGGAGAVEGAAVEAGSAIEEVEA